MADYINPALLERNRQVGGNAGANALGAIMGGGGNARSAEIYNRSALSGARLADVMAQARMRQQQQVSRERFAENARKGGDNDLADAIMSSSSINPAEIGQYKLHHQRVDFNNQAMAAATSEHPDLNSLNRIMGVISEKPTTLSDVKDNVVYDPHVTPDSQTVNPTSIGQAMIGTQHALAGEHQAQAEAARSLSEQRDRAPVRAVPAPTGAVAAKLQQMGAPPAVAAQAAQAAAARPSAAAPESMGSIMGGDPASTPDVTYDPQNRGLPNTTNSIPQAKALAAQRDVAIAATPRKIVRTGKAADGTPVVQYDDGSIEAGQ